MGRLEKLLDRKIDSQLRQLTLYRLGIVQFDLKAYGDSAKAFEELLKDAPKNLSLRGLAGWEADGRPGRPMAIPEFKACARRWPITKPQPKPDQLAATTRSCNDRRYCASGKRMPHWKTGRPRKNPTRNLSLGTRMINSFALPIWGMAGHCIIRKNMMKPWHPIRRL